MHGDNLDITPLDEQTARTHMAALFRLTAREGLHEGISNRAIRRWAALFNEPLWGAFFRYQGQRYDCIGYCKPT